ncbi:MAG: NAD-dependent epimerase/dehydratase, partial [Devosia sp.]|nr:NAD-dependent epimerase/dehydratase [Devosia sp.]
FIFISSIAASGTSGPIPIRETDGPRPTTAYGQSKLAAEREITAVAASSHLQTVCLRPPLVYGPDARGRFGQVLRWCDLGLPLPFGGLDNPRSYLSVHNLAAAVLLCLEHPGAAGTVFNIADDQALAMPQLVRLICEGLGKPCRLFAVPPPLLRAGRALGLQQSIDKLAETMLLDTTRIRDQLNWQPPIAAEAGIRTAAEQFLRQKTTRS